MHGWTKVCVGLFLVTRDRAMSTYLPLHVSPLLQPWWWVPFSDPWCQEHGRYSGQVAIAGRAAVSRSALVPRDFVVAMQSLNRDHDYSTLVLLIYWPDMQDTCFVACVRRCIFI